jgi:hypothetical protein
MRKIWILVCISCLLLPGCIEGLPFGEEDETITKGIIPMSSTEVEAILNDPAAIDIIALAEAESRFHAEIYAKELNDGEVSEFTFIIGKDDINQLAETGIEVQSGMMGIEYAIVQGNSPNINIRVGNQWFLARDLESEYVDPFIELAEDAEEEAEDDSDFDLTPDLDALELNLVGFDWVVTIDDLSFQQVATTSNDTHDIMVEFHEMPPRIHSVEVFSFDGNEASSVTLSWGEDVALEVKDDYPRTSVTIEMDEEEGTEYLDSGESIYVWVGEVNSEHEHEVAVGDLEIRIGDENEDEEFVYNLSMLLTDVTANLTDVNGDYWLIEWDDHDSNSLVSSGDEWRVETNSSDGWELEVRIYDHWAEAYEGGPLPGFDLFFLLGALAFAAVRRKIFLS